MIPKSPPAQPQPPLDDPFGPMRSAVRFPLELAVEVMTETGPVDALTRDVSSVGIQFEMAYAPRLGSAMEWSMHLPGQTMGTSEDVTVRCVGRVIWVAPSGERMSVGAVIDEYVFKSEVE